MSATRDKTQRLTFVYSNLYQLYRGGKDAALGAPEGRVLKTGSPNPDGAPATQVRVRPYQPVELIAKRVQPPPAAEEGPRAVPPPPPPDQAIASLRKNLEELNQLHSRLRFMLSELEELVKD